MRARKFGKEQLDHCGEREGHRCISVIRAPLCVPGQQYPLHLMTGDVREESCCMFIKFVIHYYQIMFERFWQNFGLFQQLKKVSEDFICPCLQLPYQVGGKKISLRINCALLIGIDQQAHINLFIKLVLSAQWSVSFHCLFRYSTSIFHGKFTQGN